MAGEIDKAACWRKFKQLVEAVGFGRLEGIEIRDGVPVHVDVVIPEINLTKEEAPAKRVSAIRSIDNS